MIDKPVTILVANYDAHEAMELCMESVIRRTRSDEPVSILVYDSPASGRDRPYLERLADNGKIGLVGGDEDLMHGPAMWRLLNACQTEWAVLLDSDCEIRATDWLQSLFGQIDDEEKDIAVAKFRAGGLLFPGELITPYYWLCCMLFNVKTYFENGARAEDWPEQSMRLEDYHGPFDFTADLKGDVSNWHVGIDTGGVFSERIISGDLRDYRVRPMPFAFWGAKVKHYGGISRNHFRPEHPEIAPRWVEIKHHLARLRGEA